MVDTNLMMELKNNGEECFTDSLEIAKLFNRNHRDVLRSIRDLLKARPDLNKHFLISSYVASNGKANKRYLLSKEGYCIMKDKYKLRAYNPSFELKFDEVLRNMFPNMLILSQYRVLDYRVDFFIPDLLVIIEYDEEFHARKKAEDSDRMEEILAELNRMIKDKKSFYDGQETKFSYDDGDRVTCVVVEKGKEIDGLRRICLEITDNTQIPCSEFMKTE